MLVEASESRILSLRPGQPKQSTTGAIIFNVQPQFVHGVVTFFLEAIVEMCRGAKSGAFCSKCHEDGVGENYWCNPFVLPITLKNFAWPISYSASKRIAEADRQRPSGPFHNTQEIIFVCMHAEQANRMHLIARTKMVNNNMNGLPERTNISKVPAPIKIITKIYNGPLPDSTQTVTQNYMLSPQPVRILLKRGISDILGGPFRSFPLQSITTMLSLQVVFNHRCRHTFPCHRIHENVSRVLYRRLR
jgi:hypothetical protein